MSVAEQYKDIPSGQKEVSLRGLWQDFRLSLVITRREIKDMVRDWRIIIPTIILITIFPLLANLVANRGMAFLNRFGANLVMERFFPFLMLVVGFFPSSFSLVIALETFVGEKERGSLEAILATPLTDLQLYIGKLLASTFLPVMASYIGMSVYALLLGLSQGWWFPPSLLLVAFVLATVQALVMVTGAVIVSSQATSARAANLLASFIIIPMAMLLQVEVSSFLYADYKVLWLIALFLVILNILLVRIGMQLFNREHLLGSDIDQLDIGGAWRVFRTALQPRSLKSLYLQEIPEILRGMRVELLLTLLSIGVGGLLVGLWGVHNFPFPVEMINLERDQFTLEGIQQQVAESGLLAEFSTGAIWWNNIRSLLAGAFLAVFSIGIGGVILLMVPMAIIAYIALQIPALSVDVWTFLAVFILPHGILEIPAAIIATAQAVRMSDVILRTPEQGGGMMGIIQQFGYFLKIFIALVVPLLLLAALIEAQITPRLAEQWWLTNFG
ncbi:MAG: stage II sporulation protein M [Anaerolineae bacterium]|nr:stage II sporulation protein M [Anaerolineae bacterium]